MNIELMKPSFASEGQSCFQQILCHIVNIVSLLCDVFSGYIQDTSGH